MKLWTHTNEWRAVSNFDLEEQPLCLDVHESGWQLALGFRTGMRIY